MLALPSFLITLAFTFLYGTAGAVNAADRRMTGDATARPELPHTPARGHRRGDHLLHAVRGAAAAGRVRPDPAANNSTWPPASAASPVRVLRPVVMPEAWPALLAGGSLVLLLTLNEFGIVLFTGARA